MIDLSPLTCEYLSVGPLENNAYLLSLNNEAILIDAADESDQLLELIGNRKLVGVITTHQHFDHIGALQNIIKETGAVAWCGVPDALSIFEQTSVACRTVWTGDKIQLGDQHLNVIGLVGHTPGSIALVSSSDSRVTHLFTGDCLFPGGVGKTESSENFRSLFNGVKELIFDKFDDTTVVHPGHGNSTTLGAQRPHLPEWKARGW